MELRIFISSPGDVTPERLIARRVVERLAREFAYHCRIEALLWERQPLVATEHFQARITKPSETDIVVLILWSRLGSPLPLAQFPGPISGGEVTGTEWEFEDAVQSYRHRALPDLMVYRKQAPVMASLEDDAELDRQRAQKASLARFVQRWFEDAGAQAFKAASHLFADPVAFEDLLETHLRELVRARIGSEATPGPGIRWHDGSPFRGLDAFEIAHAQVFFGRARARNALRELLVRQTARGSGFVLVFGASGSGKSSLVKAGLLPDLMLPGMVRGVGLCRVATMRPGDVPQDLFAGLAAALLRGASGASAAALPELADLAYDIDSLAGQLRDADTAALPIRQGLQAAHRAAGLAGHASARVALVVDQLEELFTHDFSDADRSAFIDTLAALARTGQAWVIATMRSDFFDRLAAWPALARLSEGEGRYLLTPPSAAEIGQIILQPAREAGLRFEAGPDNLTLDEMLREEASRDPAALPLLEFTLDQLWQQREPATGLLTLVAYRQLGGMAGALGSHAEQVFTALPAAVQAALPAVLRALTTLSLPSAAGSLAQRGATARTARLSQFAPGSVQRQLVDALLAPQARLLVADGGAPAGAPADGNTADAGAGADANTDTTRVRIAHEALLRRWPRAARQLESDRQDVMIRTDLEGALARWQAAAPADRDSRLLAPGRPLAEAQDLADRLHAELDPALAAFVATSTRVAEARARRRQRTRWAVTGGAVLLAAAATGAAWDARQQGRSADARRLSLAARTQLGVDQDLALLLAVEGARVLPLPDFAPLLRAGLAARGKVLQVLTHAERVPWATWDNTGQRIASVSYDGLTTAWDSAKGSVLARCDTPAAAFAAWHPQDGQTLLTGGDWAAASQIWAVADGRCSLRRQLPGKLVHAAWSPDGQSLVTAHLSGAVWLWRSDTDVLLPLPGHRGGSRVNMVAWRGDSRQVLTAGDDGSARVWDTASGMPATVHGGTPGAPAVKWAAWQPRGPGLALALADGTARVVDAASGDLLATLTGHAGALTRVAWSPDGQRLLTASTDRQAMLWDARKGSLLRVLSGHSGTLRSADWDKTGSRILTASEDWTTRVWSAHDGSQRALLAEHQGAISLAAWSPDSRRVLSASFDGSVRVRDPEAQGGMPTLESLEGALWAAWSADGQRIVTGGGGRQDGRLRLWQADSGRLLLDLAAHPADPTLDANAGLAGGVRSVAWSPDDQQLLSAGRDGKARLWDAASGGLLRELLGHTAPVNAAAFDATGHRIATASDDHTARIWSAPGGAAPGGAAIHQLDHVGAVMNLAWHPAGNLLATGSNRPPFAQIWDVRSGARTDLPGHTDQVWYSAWSPDGRRLLTAGNDGSLRLWAADGQGAGVSLAHGKGVYHAAWNAAGTRIASVCDDKRIRIWAADAKTGDAPLKVLASPGGEPRQVSWSADDQAVLVAAKDGTARLLHAVNGAELARLDSHGAALRSARFNPAGTAILTTDDKATAQLSIVRLDDLLKAACARATRPFTPAEWALYFPGETYRPTCAAAP